MRLASGLALLGVALWTTAVPAAAQTAIERPVTLEEAVAAARDGAFPLAAAEAEATIAAARARQASAFLYPRAEVGIGATYSTDPVFAFGARLRQGIFAEADFALDALNDPDAVADWAAALDVRWAALDPRRWADRTAARRGADAAAWGAARAREATELGARARYWVAVAATAHRAATEASEAAARATLDLFGRRAERGLLTEADRLRAEAELAAARAATVEAERAERAARRELGVFIGWPADAVPVPVDTLGAPPAPPSGGFDPAARADLRALAAMLASREAGRRATDLAYLPSVQAFGQLAGHGDGPAPDDDDWTLGVALRWTAFAGRARSAERAAATAAERIARLEYEHALRAAVAEVDVADHAIRAAAEASDAAVRAFRASETAARLVGRRFEEGLATATDVLQAEARLAAARSRAVDARTGWRLAVDRAGFARSTSPAEEIR